MSETKDNLEIFKVKESAFTGRFLLWFGGVILFIAVAFFFCITFIPIPAANIRFADTILGFMGGTLVSTVVNFYYGSSKQSKDKDNTLDALVKNQSENNGVKGLVQGGNNVTVSPADTTKTTVTDNSTTITPDTTTEAAENTKGIVEQSTEDSSQVS